MHRASHQFRSSGFSLFELVLVLAIMGIMAAIASPRYARSLARYRVDMAARRIAADITLAQARARNTSGSQTITFDTTAEQYSIVGMADPDNRATNYVVNLSEEPYLATLGTVNFNGSSTLTFNGYGDPASSGSITVSTGDTTKTITVSGDTGSVVIR
jgi:type II secretion system protein H